MARIRSIKPEFWSSLTIAKLSSDARLTFIGLWNYADDHGRAIDDLRLIKAAVWPLDDKATIKRISGWMSEIAALGLIHQYVSGGVGYFHITTWGEHQRVDHPKDSTFPAPPSRDARESVENPSREPREASPASRARAEGRGREGIGKEQGAGKGEDARANLANGWVVHPGVEAYRTRSGVKQPPLEKLQRRIETEIASDLVGWDEVLSFWEDNGYRWESVGKMLDKYHENQKRRKVGNGSSRKGSRVGGNGAGAWINSLLTDIESFKTDHTELFDRCEELSDLICSGISEQEARGKFAELKSNA